MGDLERGRIGKEDETERESQPINGGRIGGKDSKDTVGCS